MRELFKIELEKVSGGLMERPTHPGEGGIRNAINPINRAGKPKGWAGAIVMPPPTRGSRFLINAMRPRRTGAAFCQRQLCGLCQSPPPHAFA